MSHTNDIIKLCLSVCSACAFCVLGACASRSSVADQYHDAVHDRGESAAKTSIVFLVDGLSVPVFERALGAGHMPNVSTFFKIDPSAHVNLGRASFPTLTYPNLTSILTAEPVSQHGILGNRVLDEHGAEVNFERIYTWNYLNERVGEKLIFTQLARDGESSVSYSYPFSHHATATQQKSFDVGIDYAKKNYGAVDLLTLQSLQELLKNSSTLWPRLIFVHLIGVDALEHQFGPDDDQVQNYLSELDGHLANVLARIVSVQDDGTKVSTVLTADHGFVSTENVIPIADIASRLPAGLRVLPDNRLTSIYLPKEWSQEARQGAAEGFLGVHHLAWVALHSGSKIELYNAGGRRARIDLKRSSSCRHGPWMARFEWTRGSIDVEDLKPLYRCMEDYDFDASFTNATYLVPALVEYFTADSAPDLVLVADSHSDFDGGYKGNHGGLTPEEILVPVLTRNFTPSDKGVSPTWRLLRDLKFK